MPGMDGTGPFGTGPVARRMGPCSGGLTNRGGFFQGGRGGFRRGGPAGWGFAPTALSAEEERSLLEQQKSWLEKQVEVITKRLQGLVKE